MWPFRKRAAVNPAQQAVTGNFNLTATLGQSGRTMQIAGYIYDGESKESLQGRIDILRSIMEREKTLAEIPELEARKDQMLKGIAQAREVMADLEEKQKSGQISSQERMNLKNMKVNVAKMLEEVGKGDTAIKEAREKVAARG